MPTAADRLRKGASDSEVRDAVSECIRQMKGEHPDWETDRCVAACYSMAEKASGRKIARKG